MPKSRLRQLLKFIRVFGVAGGLRLWVSLLMQLSKRASLLEINIPGLATPFRLRPNDLPIFWQIMVMKENDFASLPQAAQVQQAYSHILSEGHRPVIVDCGGHVGLSAVWFASRFPEATLYCIEPDPTNFSLLQRNTSAYPNVTAVNGGVWNRSCHLKISNPHSGSASFRLEEVPESDHSDLRGYSVAEFAQREPDNRLFLVKMDIEGAESQVFKADAQWLESAKVVVIELHDWLLPGQGTSRNFFKRLSENSFDVVLQGENLLLFQVPTPDAESAPPLHSEMLAANS